MCLHAGGFGVLPAQGPLLSQLGPPRDPLFLRYSSTALLLAKARVPPRPLPLPRPSFSTAPNLSSLWTRCLAVVGLGRPPSAKT